MKKTPKKCGCADKVDAELAEHNAKLDRRLTVNFTARTSGVSAPILSVVKINTKNRKPLPTIVCAHCPFCGVKLPE